MEKELYGDAPPDLLTALLYFQPFFSGSAKQKYPDGGGRFATKGMNDGIEGTNDGNRGTNNIFRL